MTPEFWGLVGQYGFPMVITAYLLIKQDATIKGLTEAIAQNTLMLSRIEKGGVGNG